MRRLWRSALDRVTPYEAGPPIEAIERVIDALRREAARAHLYPDGGATALREALAHRLGVEPGWLIVGNGGDEILTLVARAAYEPGDEVLMPHPVFEPYETEAHVAGVSIVRSPLAGYETDLDDMRRRVTSRTKAVLVCTPHNPASTTVAGRALAGFLESLGAEPPLIVLDEAYRDFCDDPDTLDGVALLRRHPTVVSVRTFSKIAGLAGLRVGYAIARPEAIDRLNRVRAPFNVSRLAQAAALAALEDPGHMARTRALVLEERRRLAEALRARGATVPPSQANFLLVRVGEAAGALRAALAREGILIRDGAAVGFPGHLRVSVGTREVNDRLLAVWDATLAVR
jgi:histidinol-phosphate aminotransferase